MPSPTSDPTQADRASDTPPPSRPTIEIAIELIAEEPGADEVAAAGFPDDWAADS